MSDSRAGLQNPEATVNYICHKCQKPPESLQNDLEPVLHRPRLRALCHGEKETIQTLRIKDDVARFGHVPLFLERAR